MKDKITIILFISIISIFSLGSIIKKDEKISIVERRKLQTFPSFTLTSEYITTLDKYFVDHFFLKDDFRRIKANYQYKVLKRLDNNDIFLKDDNIYKSNYPTNDKSITNFINKISYLKQMLSKDNNLYFMMIPDKNYYLNDKNFLQIDYHQIEASLNKLEMKNIIIKDILTKEDYYKTDPHWKQENLDKVVKKMSEIMAFNYQNIASEKHVYHNFYGVYYGEASIYKNPEKLIYLTNNFTEDARVTYLENKHLTEVYNLNKLNSYDSYEVFLDGASSFIEITNKSSYNDKELVIFRDSFASSLTPLLIPYYKKITLIDNRYIKSDYLKDKIKFTNQDVLFMYSTLIINNSGSLKG